MVAQGQQVQAANDALAAKLAAAQDQAAKLAAAQQLAASVAVAQQVIPIKSAVPLSPSVPPAIALAPVVQQAPVKQAPAPVLQAPVQAPVKQDCAVSGWSGCSKPCGGGTQTRTVAVPAANGGSACPALSQACNAQACPVDCAVSGWSGCSKPCGGGTQSRTVTVKSANGGLACPALTQACNTQTCPVDCQVGNWTDCSLPCGGGMQTRRAVVGAAFGGAACPALVQGCGPSVCPPVNRTSIDGHWRAPNGWDTTIRNTSGLRSGQADTDMKGRWDHTARYAGSNRWALSWWNGTVELDKYGRLVQTGNPDESYKFKKIP
jgi:hypothetical protein